MKGFVAAFSKVPDKNISCCWYFSKVAWQLNIFSENSIQCIVCNENKYLFKPNGLAFWCNYTCKCLSRRKKRYIWHDSCPHNIVLLKLLFKIFEILKLTQSTLISFAQIWNILSKKSAHNQWFNLAKEFISKQNNLKKVIKKTLGKLIISSWVT
jgi:hypothetical protein